MQMRTPPNHLEAEVSVLGGLLVGPEPEVFSLVLEILDSTDFYKPAHQKIYKVMVELHNSGNPVDIVTVCNALKAREELESIGGSSVLAEVMNSGPTAVNIEQHSKIVKEKSLLRKFIHETTGLLNRAYNQSYENIEAFIDEAEGKVLGVTNQWEVNTELVSTYDLMKLSMDRLRELSEEKQDITGLPSGFSPLDKMTAGFQPGDFIIIAARPSMGKTALSLNMALNASVRNKKTVAYFSVEMSKEQLMMRILGIEARVNISDLRVGRIKDNDWPRLIEKAGFLGEAPFFIDDTSGISPQEIRSKARRLKQKQGLDMIVVDYLQIMRLRTRVESREREVAEISRSLKALAKELNIPVIALAQLNRGVEGRTGEARKPLLSDLRESGSIEQDADLIMMLYREEYYDRDNLDVKGQADLLVRKHRNGPVGNIQLKWEPEYSSFTDWYESTHREALLSPLSNDEKKLKNLAPESSPPF